MRNTTFAKLSISSMNESAAVSFLFDEEAKRDLQTIKIARINAVARKTGVLSLKVQLHRDMEPARLGWPATNEHKLTLAETTQLATSRVMDPTRRIKKREFGIRNRSAAIVETDTMITSKFSDKAKATMPTEITTPLPEQYFQIFLQLGTSKSFFK
jgi:hypothetical protein